jgi:hypothetical protein
MKKMKKSILVAIAILAVILPAQSQNIDDAVRYSQIIYTGTARMNAMGGAFTSLGADLSAISLNPAGAGMFRSFEMSVTPKLIYNNTSAVFNDQKNDDFRYTFGLSQAGFSANMKLKEESSGLVGLNLGYTYNGSSNFNENTIIKGVSNNTSMADYWAISSDGIYYKNLSGSAGIAYDAWIIDTLTGSGAKQYGTIFSNYGDNPNSTYGQTINRVITNEGYMGEHTFFIGANVAEKFFFGASFGINTLQYMGHYQHTEADYDNVIPDFKNFVYTDHLEASGTGYSFKVGGILRLFNILRLGAAFHSPVIYSIDEYYFDDAASEFDNFQQYQATNKPLTYTYSLTTPYRVLTGASLQLGKLGIVTADYEYVDYRKSKFSNASDGYNYQYENSTIQTSLKASSNLRLGTEIRLNAVYLRAGAGLYGSAFTDGEVNEDSYYTTASAGIGLRQNNFYFDMGYVYQMNDQKYYMYEDPPYLEPAYISYRRNTFTATLGIKF